MLYHHSLSLSPFLSFNLNICILRGKPLNDFLKETEFLGPLLSWYQNSHQQGIKLPWRVSWQEASQHLNQYTVIGHHDKIHQQTHHSTLIKWWWLWKSECVAEGVLSSGWYFVLEPDCAQKLTFLWSRDWILSCQKKLPMVTLIPSNLSHSLACPPVPQVWVCAPRLFKLVSEGWVTRPDTAVTSSQNHAMVMLWPTSNLISPVNF